MLSPLADASRPDFASLLACSYCQLRSSSLKVRYASDARLLACRGTMPYFQCLLACVAHLLAIAAVKQMILSANVACTLAAKFVTLNLSKVKSLIQPRMHKAL